MNNPDSVDVYLNQFEGEQRQRLDVIRKIIKAEAPEATESISYGLVGYKLNKKPLAYFGGFANHTGFYATPHGHAAFTNELSKYKQGKGSVQFPIDKPLPTDLITKMVQFKKEELSGKGR